MSESESERSTYECIILFYFILFQNIQGCRNNCNVAANRYSYQLLLHKRVVDGVIYSMIFTSSYINV